MNERLRRTNSVRNPPNMEIDFSPAKTGVVVVIVIGCFAVLMPNVFYPMLMGSAQQQMKPSDIDRTAGCCDVISDNDVGTIKIMSELCGNIIRVKYGGQKLSGKEVVQICKKEVLETCGIDVSAILQEQVRLGQSVKDILNEIRSMNGSLCLKYNYGVPVWELGIPHRVTLKLPIDTIRQERPPNIREEMLHPAFRERGRAIPQGSRVSSHKIVEGRPGPLPGMRPTMGGPGHIVQSKQSGSMGIIMPLYTIGIVIFFAYTLMKIFFKKHPDINGVYGSEEDEYIYTKEMLPHQNLKDGKLVVNAMSALLDEVDQELEARRKFSETAQDEHAPGTNLLNGSVKKEEELPTVKILGMETQASCEDNKKWTSIHDPNLHNSHPDIEKTASPPKEIYLEATLPPESQILVADSKVEAQKIDESAIVLSGKMTLSVVNIDGENESADKEETFIDRNNEIEDIHKAVQNIQVHNEIEHIQEINNYEPKNNDNDTANIKESVQVTKVSDESEECNDDEIEPKEDNENPKDNSINYDEDIEDGNLDKETKMESKNSIDEESSSSVGTVEDLVISAENEDKSEESEEEVEYEVSEEEIEISDEENDAGNLHTINGQAYPVLKNEDSEEEDVEEEEVEIEHSGEEVTDEEEYSEEEETNLINNHSGI